MSKKRAIEQDIDRLRRVKTWQLVVILLLLGFVTATLLRLNNIGMIQRRDAVLAADQEGDVDTMRSRLFDLQRYSSQHMNASTESFYLEEQFHRDAEAAKKLAIDMYSSGENIYKKVDQEICAPIAKANNWRWPDPRYTNCLASELEKYPEASVDPDVKLPAPETYRHSFESPVWSPDFAGFAVLACIILTGVIVLRILSLAVLHVMLRAYRSKI